MLYVGLAFMALAVFGALLKIFLWVYDSYYKKVVLTLFDLIERRRLAEYVKYIHPSPFNVWLIDNTQFRITYTGANGVYRVQAKVPYANWETLRVKYSPLACNRTTDMHTEEEARDAVAEMIADMKSWRAKSAAFDYAGQGTRVVDTFGVSEEKK